MYARDIQLFKQTCTDNGITHFGCGQSVMKDFKENSVEFYY